MTFRMNQGKRISKIHVQEWRNEKCFFARLVHGAASVLVGQNIEMPFAEGVVHFIDQGEELLVPVTKIERERVEAVTQSPRDEHHFNARGKFQPGP